MFSALLFNFRAASRIFLNGVGCTFDHIPLDGLDGHHLKGILVPAFEDLSELSVSYFFLQHVLVNHFRHHLIFSLNEQYIINNNINVQSASNRLDSLSGPGSKLQLRIVLQHQHPGLPGLPYWMPLVLRLKSMHNLQYK